MGGERNGIGSGLVLITIGLIFLADRQGYGGFGHLWPLILIIMGAAKMLFPGDRFPRAGVVAGRRGCREHRFSGLWLIMVGMIFLLHQNDVLRLSRSWPLFIVAAGLGVIFSGIFNRKDHDGHPTDASMGQGGQ